MRSDMGPPVPGRGPAVQCIISCNYRTRVGPGSCPGFAVRTTSIGGGDSQDHDETHRSPTVFHCFFLTAVYCAPRPIDRSAAAVSQDAPVVEASRQESWRA